MLRLFSNIRKSLIAGNNTVKYLKYAVGEFLLIVAGILVALQIQNWNEERLNRIEEREILSRILKELELNIDFLGFHLENLKGKTEALKRLAENFESQSFESPKSFLNDVISGHVYGWRHPRMEKFRFEEFQNAGKLGLVRNQELLEGIMKFYVENDRMDNRGDVRASGMLDVSADLIPFQYGAPGLLAEDLSEEQYMEVANRVLKSDLHLHFIREQNRGEWLLYQWSFFIERGTLLKSEIEAELNK